MCMQRSPETQRSNDRAASSSVRTVLARIPRNYIAGQPERGNGETLSFPLTSIPGERFDFFTVDSEQISRAVEKADIGFKAWSRLGGAVRAATITRIANEITANSENIAQLQTLEAARPLRQSRDSVRFAADYLRELADLAHAMPTSVQVADGVTVHHEPLGPVAVVTSWNLGFFNIVQAVGTVLLAGCSAVIKPSERAPFTAEAFVGLAKDAGVPKGTVNVVLGNAETAQKLVQNKQIKAVHLTVDLKPGKR